LDCLLSLEIYYYLGSSLSLEMYCCLDSL